MDHVHSQGATSRFYRAQLAGPSEEKALSSSEWMDKKKAVSCGTRHNGIVFDLQRKKDSLTHDTTWMNLEVRLTHTLLGLE